jgi:hypothetical protein
MLLVSRDLSGFAYKLPLDFISLYFFKYAETKSILFRNLLY